MRILIVEDERELARTLARAIQEAGMTAEVACDGERGLQLAREQGFDALLLDLLLPRRHGLDVLREVKAARPGLPVLVLTALSDVDDVVKGLDRGADDYLTKPFALAELLARLRAILRRGRLPSSFVRVADLELDLAARSVRRGGRPIDLTAREFALLQLLVHRPGQVLSRSEIGACLIDREFEETSNMIDVSICGLRSKLGEPDLIRTVRGAGYSLSGEPGA